MSLQMLGAKPSKTVPPTSKPSLKSSPTKGAALSSGKSSLKDPQLDTLVKELQTLGTKHQNHKNPKIAALAKKALTAASSLQVQGGHGPAVGASASTGAAAAKQVLQQLKDALANEPKAPAKTDTAAAAKAVAAAQAKLKISAQKMVASANTLKAKAQNIPKKGKGSQAVAARGQSIATKLSGAGSKLLALASKSIAPKSTASMKKVAIGDDLSDAQAQLQAAQQALADAKTDAQAVSDALTTAKQADDTANSNPPDTSGMRNPSNYPPYVAWLSAAQAADTDYQTAMNAAMTLIFNDTSLADAATAVNDANALVAAIQGLPPPGSQPGTQPLAPPPFTPTGGAGISPAAPSVAAGATTKLSFTVNGQVAPATPPVLWSSSNSQVASVDQTGLVTANGPGSANITAAQGKSLAQAQVTVTGQLNATINPPQVQLSLGQGGQPPLQFMVNGQPPPVNAAIPVTWTSSNPTVVTVDAMGNVNALGPGYASITATRGSATATAQVTVTDPNAMQQMMPGGGSAGGGGGGGPSGGDDGGGYGGDDGGGYADDGGAPADDGGGDDGAPDSDTGDGDDGAPDSDTGDGGDDNGDGGDGSSSDDNAGNDDTDVDVDGGLQMLGASFDYGGLLQAAGGALSGKQQAAQVSPQQQVQQQVQQVEAQKKQAEAASAKTMTIVKWVAGGLAGLVGLVFVGKLLRKVIA